MMRRLCISCFILLFACHKPARKHNSVELITKNNEQTALFLSLMNLTNNAIPETSRDDSLAFLILPVQASCPSCRKKTIDSIAKYEVRLAPRHFVIISAMGGKKTIRGYFKEEDKDLPQMDGQLFLDSSNQADKRQLCDDKPTMYYTFEGKAYKKVAAIPSTVRQDLQEFFSGFRDQN